MTKSEELAFRINSDGTAEQFVISETNPLKQFQKIVGGLIEPIDLPKLKMTMWVNEEGIIHDLPINVIASAIVQSVYAPRQTVPMLGDVYFTNIETDEQGNTLGLSKAGLEFLAKVMKGASQ